MPRRFVFLTIPFMLFAGILIAMGIQRGSPWVIGLGAFSLLTFAGSAWQRWQAHLAMLEIDRLLACPQCGSPLDLRWDSRSHAGQAATDKVHEACKHCGYSSEPFTLVYPLEAELAALLEEEQQAQRIADRRAEEAWLRTKRA
jgi:uncharacterized protein YbaR (Trm112 family)